MTKAKAIVFRFFTMFLSGGVSSALILFSNPTQFSNVTDVKKIATSIIIAFLVGGISAVEKSLVDLQTTTQTVITSTAVGSNSAPQSTIITATTNVPEDTSVTQIQSISDPSVTRQPMAMSSAPISDESTSTGAAANFTTTATTPDSVAPTDTPSV